MEAQKKSNTSSLFIGVVAGSASALIVWVILSKVLDKQFAKGRTELVSKLTAGRTDLQSQLAQARGELGTMVRQELDRQLPPTLRRELQSTLSEYGLTPQVAAQVRNLVSYASRSGWL